MLFSKRVVSGILLVIGVVLGGVCLPLLRKNTWKSTVESSQEESGLSIEDEAEVQRMVVLDQSSYEKERDLRFVTEIPTSAVGLESVFRQRKNDACETLVVSSPLVIDDFSLMLTQRDQYRSDTSNTLPSTRVPVLTIGLNMQSADQRSLPSLSRSIILNYIDSNFVSIQARVMQDPLDRSLILHYRPIAAVGSFSGQPITIDYVDAINSTIKNVRGLGIYRKNIAQTNSTNASLFQIAILLFRSTFIDELGLEFPRHELGFICLNRKSGEKPNISFIATTNERKKWLVFSNDSKQMPKRISDCSMVATVRFNEFMTGGLQPKSSVVRRISNSAEKEYDVESIEKYLEGLDLQGGWSTNLDIVVEGLLEGRISRSNQPSN